MARYPCRPYFTPIVKRILMLRPTVVNSVGSAEVAAVDYETAFLLIVAVPAVIAQWSIRLGLVLKGVDVEPQGDPDRSRSNLE